MHRAQRVASIMRAVYWLIIIGVTVGTFYLLEPYIEQLKAVYGGASDVLKTFDQFKQQ